MGEKKRIVVLWIVLAFLLAAGIGLAAFVGPLTLKPIKAVDVGGLLATFFVLALFVERTLEVFITAWRGEETVKREADLAATQTALAKEPANPELQAPVKSKNEWLIEYKCETQAIALRCGLVLGILVAAVGVRAFPTFVVLASAGPDPTGWVATSQGVMRVLDVLISGGIIGGGSDAVHKMMNVVTGFFDATTAKMRAGQPAQV